MTATRHFNTRTLPWPSVTPRGLHDLEGSKYSSARRIAALKKKRGCRLLSGAGLPVDVEALKIQAINLWIFRAFESLFGAAPWIINDLKASDPLTLSIQLAARSGLEGPGRKKKIQQSHFSPVCFAFVFVFGWPFLQ